MVDDTVRACWLIAGDEGYGAATQARQLLGGLADLGVDVSVVSLQAGSFASECSERFQTIVLNRSMRGTVDASRRSGRARAASRTLALTATGWRDVARAVSTVGADVVLVAWPDLLPIASVVSRILRSPLIWQPPNNVRQTRLALNRRFFALCIRVGDGKTVASSTYQAQQLRPFVDCRVIALGVDGQTFKPLVRQTLDSISYAAPVAIQVGRIDDQKGQLLLVEAAKSVPGLHVLLVGSPSDSDVASRLVGLRRSPELRGRVHLTGMVHDPWSYYQFADFAVSFQSPEPFGLGVVEAMMSGRPVLAVANGGPAENIIDRQTGWLIPERSLSAAVNGLQMVVDQNEAWPQLGVAARRHAETRFSVQVQAAEWKIFLTQVCKGSQRTGGRSDAQIRT